MDISSTTSATISMADTNASAKSQQSSKSDSSFKDEMSKVEKNEDTKNSSKIENKSEEKTESKSDEKTENKQDSKIEGIPSTSKKDNNDSRDIELNQPALLNGEINMSMQQIVSTELKSQMLSDNIQTLIDANQQLANVDG